jgi:hypothetical protein
MDKCTRFVALMAIKVIIRVFAMAYDICKLVHGYRKSGLKYCLHLQGKTEPSLNNSMTNGQLIIVLVRSPFLGLMAEFSVAV